METRSGLRRYFNNGPLGRLRRRIGRCATFWTASATLDEMPQNTHSFCSAVDDLDGKDQRRQYRVTQTNGFKKAQHDLRLKGLRTSDLHIYRQVQQSTLTEPFVRAGNFDGV